MLSGIMIRSRAHAFNS